VCAVDAASQVSAFDIAKACFEWVRYYVDHSFDFRKNPVM